MIKVITWNLLSPQISDLKYFINYDPNILNTSLRLKRIMHNLSVLVKQKPIPIFCFQELPFDWKGIFETFFYRNGYRMISINYGGEQTGFVGIAIAIPKEYKIENIDYIPVGDILDLPTPNEIYYRLNYPDNYATKEVMKKSYAIINEETTRINEIMLKADEIQNTAIRVVLRSDFQFILYNYHFPHNDLVRLIHLNALKRLMKTHENVPTIFAGDFNFSPDDILYSYITNNKLTKEYYAYLKEDYKLDLRSAYKDYNGKEADHTIYINSKISDGIMRDTLDYIFISQQLKAVSSKTLLNTNNLTPNEICPSDHLPLEAVITLMNRE